MSADQRNRLERMERLSKWRRENVLGLLWLMNNWYLLVFENIKVTEMEGGPANEEKPSEEEWPVERAEVG